MAAGTPSSPDPNADTRVPDQFSETTLAAEIRTRLAAGNTAAIRQKAMVWTDRGDEVLVHLDSLRVKTADRLLIVSVELETDQTGRTPLVCAFAFGTDKDPAGLVAVTDELPRGNGVLAARWGKILQEALWASVLAISADHATGVKATAIGISVTPGSLQLHTAATPVRLERVGNPGGNPGDLRDPSLGDLNKGSK